MLRLIVAWHVWCGGHLLQSFQRSCVIRNNPCSSESQTGTLKEPLTTSEATINYALPRLACKIHFICLFFLVLLYLCCYVSFVFTFGTKVLFMRFQQTSTEEPLIISLLLAYNVNGVVPVYQMHIW